MGALFNNWENLERILVLGIVGYISLILLLRISGNRTLSKLNAFDFVIAIALGSTFGSLILNKNVALAEGIMAFAILVGLQYIVAWLAVRSEAIKKLIKNEPSLLYYKGEYLIDAMKSSRVVKSEIEQSVRNQGYPNLQTIEAIIIETDGSFSIINQSGKSNKELSIVRIKT